MWKGIVIAVAIASCGGSVGDWRPDVEETPPSLGPESVEVMMMGEPVFLIWTKLPGSVN